VSFSYDAVGNLRFHTGPAGVIEYRYSAVNLLSQLVQPGGAITSYGYDNDDNRTSTTHPNGVVVTNAFNAEQRHRDHGGQGRQRVREPGL
jgi:YD repeat-containing protein